jgi:hypothetical protein
MLPMIISGVSIGTIAGLVLPNLAIIICYAIFLFLIGIYLAIKAYNAAADNVLLKQLQFREKEEYPKIKLLKEILPEHIQAFKSKRMEEVSLTTTHNNIKVVKTMFKWAVKHTPPYIKDDPAEKVGNLSKIHP